MKNYDKLPKINHNPNCPYILDHPNKTLILDCSGSGKTNVLLNLTKHQRADIDNIYLFVKDPCKTKYQLFINRREKVGIKQTKNPKAFNDCLQTIDDAYESLKYYNLK